MQTRITTTLFTITLCVFSIGILKGALLPQFHHPNQFQHPNQSQISKKKSQFEPSPQHTKWNPRHPVKLNEGAYQQTTRIPGGFCAR
jgi:hypothetical protein